MVFKCFSVGYGPCRQTFRPVDGEEVDLGDGEICIFPPGSTISECSGACPSHDRSPLKFLDSDDVFRHDKDCTCCSGSGSYRRQDLLCGTAESSYAVSCVSFQGKNRANL